MVLAEWAGIAIENARLYQASERRRDELEASVRRLEATTAIARAIGGETDLDRVLELIVKRGRALVGARGMVILLAEEPGLVVAATAGEISPSFRGTRLPAGDARGGPRRARRRTGSTRRCSCRWASAGARSACSPPSAAIPRARTSSCCWRSPPARRRRSPPRGRWRRSGCASRSPARRPSARAGRASCTTRRCRASAACGCSSPPRAGATTPARCAPRSRRSSGTIDGEIEGLRTLIRELRPAALDELGPAPAIEELAARTAARHGLEVDDRPGVRPGAARPRSRPRSTGSSRRR